MVHQKIKLKWFLHLVFATVIGVLSVACHPYGDTADETGIHNSNVQESALAGTWATDAGGEIVIAPDASFSDARCSRAGQVMYVSREDSCPAGSSSCGSLTMTQAPYNSTTGCGGSGQVVCEFFMQSSGSSASTLNMACADSTTKFNLILSHQ